MLLEVVSFNMMLKPGETTKHPHPLHISWESLRYSRSCLCLCQKPTGKLEASDLTSVHTTLSGRGKDDVISSFNVLRHIVP